MANQSIEEIFHLAIETTGRNGSIAVLRGDQILQQQNLDEKVRTAASLAPQVDQTLKSYREQGNPISLVSVADGPGSFTGLRIGITTAKTLGYALELPLVAVDSLAAIASAAFHENPSAHSLCVGVDAYRQQVFAGTFCRDDLLPSLNSPPSTWSAHPDGVSVLSAEQWQQRLGELSSDVRITGDPKTFGPLADQCVTRGCDAVGVGLLAIRAYRLGQTIDPLELLPRYLKASAAEEKL